MQYSQGIKNADSHALLYIGTTDAHPKIIAWVCVHENLYLGWDTADEKPKEKNWAYISPEDYHGKTKDAINSGVYYPFVHVKLIQNITKVPTQRAINHIFHSVVRMLIKVFFKLGNALRKYGKERILIYNPLVY